MAQAFEVGSPALDAPAVTLLRKLVALLPADRPLTITVFGSAPLQIQLERTFTSADVDVFCNWEELAELVSSHRLGTGQTEFYIQVCSELNFRTSPRWKDRTQSFQIGPVTFILPHPIDILIAKLHRLDEKDLAAFRLVRDRTGHPTDAEFVEELQAAVDLFRPSFDEEQGQDLAMNCRRLWPIFFGREIDPRKEIIAPALEIRRKGYGLPTRDYRQELRDALAEAGGAP